MRIAAIDQGTTSTRVLIASSNNDPEVIHSIEHTQLYPQSGWVEHDPQEIIKNIQSCADVAGLVDAFGIDNQGESCLAWDKETKKPLSNIIVWQDNRTLDQIEKLKAQGFEAKTLEIAGLPLDTYFSASKLGWIIKNNKKAQAALKKGNLRLGTTDAFFLDRMTDNFVTDITTASRTSLMNIATGEWDKDLCKIFAVPIETLPKIVPSTGNFGSIKTKHGLIPITASIVDQQAALYGFGCKEMGEAKITFGTGAFALMITGEQIFKKPKQGLLPTIAWQKYGEKPTYALDGGIYTASAAINWAKSLGLFSDLSEINSFYGSAASDSGLIFMPALSGLACPHWDRQARGMWLGLSLDHKPEQLVQAILEGIAFRAAEVIEAMNECTPLGNIILIDGGMSKNPYFCQFLADVLQKEVRPSNLPELTAYGVALLAADFIKERQDGKLQFKPSQFSSYKPQNNRAKTFAKFKKAIIISKNWVG